MTLTLTAHALCRFVPDMFLHAVTNHRRAFAARMRIVFVEAMSFSLAVSLGF